MATAIALSEENGIVIWVPRLVFLVWDLQQSNRVKRYSCITWVDHRSTECPSQKPTATTSPHSIQLIWNLIHKFEETDCTWDRHQHGGYSVSVEMQQTINEDRFGNAHWSFHVSLIYRTLLLVRLYSLSFSSFRIDSNVFRCCRWVINNRGYILLVDSESSIMQ